MVPIVEPEVLMDGEHSAKDCYEKTSEVIKKCFDELILHNVDLKGIILKPNMILAGNKSKDKISSEEVAKLTLKCLKKFGSIRSTWNCFFIWGSVRNWSYRKFKFNK